MKMRSPLTPNGMECSASGGGETSSQLELSYVVAYPQSVGSTTVHFSLDR